MKRYLLALITIILTILIQSSFFVEFFGVARNPILVLALAFAVLMLNKKEFALFTAFLGGILLDSLGTNPIGLSSLVFVGLILSAHFIRKFLIKNYTSQALVAVVGTFLYIMLSNYPEGVSIRESLGCAMLTVLSMFVFYFVGRYFRNEKSAL
jgi:rod shape-determining protein MreD